MIPVVWISMEASVYYLKIRQHRWLGEGDALLCNRMGLWCLVGVCWVVVECVAAGQQMIFELTQRWLASLSFALALLELSAVVMIWLVFYPPAIYRRLINRTSMPHARAACANYWSGQSTGLRSVTSAFAPVMTALGVLGDRAA